MKCPHCEETIDDHSAFCAFCGHELGHKFCARCGGGMEKSAGGNKFLVMMLIVFVCSIVVMQMVRKGETTPMKSQATVTTRQAEKPYTIVSTEETTFGGHTMYEMTVRVSPFAKKAGVVITAKDIGRGKLLQNPDSIVVMRIFTNDTYKEQPDLWQAEAVAVDLKRNPTYTFSDPAFEDMGDSVFLRWRE